MTMQMGKLGQRGVVAGLLLGSALVMATAAAFACTVGPLLRIDDSLAARPGQVMTISGSSFVPQANPELGHGPVVFRWNTMDGPVLARAVPDAQGNVSAQLRIPQVAPGPYLVLAGTEAPGSALARSVVEVVGAGPRAASPPSPWAATQSQPGRPGQGLPVPLVAFAAVLGVAGLSVLGAGLHGAGRQVRRSRMAVAESVVRSDNRGA